MILSNNHSAQLLPRVQMMLSKNKSQTNSICVHDDIVINMTELENVAHMHTAATQRLKTPQPSTKQSWLAPGLYLGSLCKA